MERCGRRGRPAQNIALLTARGDMRKARAGWAKILEIDYRPHLLVVQVGTPTDSASDKRRADFLRRLVEDLRSCADYAILLEESEVQIAFVSELDAKITGALLASRGALFLVVNATCGVESAV
jgi:hypothetical protein